MAVRVVIKQKGFFGKRVDIKEILKEEQLSFGVADGNFILVEHVWGKRAVVFDNRMIGRGIEIQEDLKEVTLGLPLPTTREDIKMFYHLVKRICEKMNVTIFYRDGQKTTFNQIDTLIEADINASIKALDDIEKKIYLAGTDSFVLYGALHPISIGEKEIDMIDGSLDNFAKLLNDLQQETVYFAGASVYRRANGSYLGVYTIDEEVLTVLPTDPFLFQTNLQIDDWYVLLPGENMLLLSTFWQHVKEKTYYDYDHNTVYLEEDEIIDLVSKYSVNTMNNQPIKGYYFGLPIDKGEFHMRNQISNDLNYYSHIAAYLYYAYTHHLFSDTFWQAIPEFQIVIDEKTLDLRTFVKENRYLQGQIAPGFFNDEARKFTLEYYNLNQEGYLKDVQSYASTRLGSKEVNHNPAYLEVPYDEDYLQNICLKIDHAWQEYVEKEKMSV